VSSCETSLTDKGVFTVNYDSTNSVMIMNCTIPDSSYAGWGWGKSMDNTEMVIFSANGISSSAITYFSKGKDTPTLEPSQ